MISCEDKELQSRFHSAINVILAHLTTKFGSEIKETAKNMGISKVYTIFKAYFPEISNYDEVTSLEKYLLKNTTYARHFSEKFGVKNWVWPFDFNGLLKSIIGDYVQNHGLDYNENLVDQYYDDLELALIHNKIKIYIRTPVIGLFSSEKEIKINDEVSFVKLNGQRDVGSSHFNTSLVTYVMAFHDMIYKFYQKKIFESEVQEKENKEKDWTTARAQIRDFMMVLRLYKAGKIGFLDSSLTYSISHAGNTWENQECGLESDWSKWEKDPYLLTSNDVENIKKLWEELHKIDFQKSVNKFLLSTITRFMLSYQKEDLEDKILDLMICLEGLLLDTPAELSYRLSIRTALFSGQNTAERNRIFKVIKKGYNVRSGTVHGDETSTVTIDGTEISLKDLHKEIENYVRIAIKQFISKINNNETRSQIINSIDNSLFS